MGQVKFVLQLGKYITIWQECQGFFEKTSKLLGAAHVFQKAARPPRVRRSCCVHIIN
jgi:hypothetical protein